MASRRQEAGYSLLALLSACTIALILMAAAMPTWRYIMKDDREEELIFRGGEIADAIGRYQKKNGNAYPTSLQVLVKGKFLRKLYKDPMTKSGEWRLVRVGQNIGAINPLGGPGIPGVGASPSPSPSPSGTQPEPTSGNETKPGAAVGPIVGVASTSKEKGLRRFNGKDKYQDWIFAVGQARIVGNTPISIVPGQVPGGPPKPGQGVQPPGPVPGPSPQTP